MAILDREEPIVVLRKQDDSMGWLSLVLLGVGLLTAFMLTRKELPAMRRYMKIRSM